MVLCFQTFAREVGRGASGGSLFGKMKIDQCADHSSVKPGSKTVTGPSSVSTCDGIVLGVLDSVMVVSFTGRP